MMLTVSTYLDDYNCEYFPLITYVLVIVVVNVVIVPFVLEIQTNPSIDLLLSFAS